MNVSNPYHTVNLDLIRMVRYHDPNLYPFLKEALGELDLQIIGIVGDSLSFNPDYTYEVPVYFIAYDADRVVGGIVEIHGFISITNPAARDTSKTQYRIILETQRQAMLHVGMPKMMLKQLHVPALNNDSESWRYACWRRAEALGEMPIYVGMGVTQIHPNDSYPYTIVEIVGSREIAITGDSYVYNREKDEYLYASNMSHMGSIVVTKRRDGKWRRKGTSSRDSMGYIVGYRHYYRCKEI